MTVSLTVKEFVTSIVVDSTSDSEHERIREESFNVEGVVVILLGLDGVDSPDEALLLLEMFSSLRDAVLGTVDSVADAVGLAVQTIIIIRRTGGGLHDDAVVRLEVDGRIGTGRECKSGIESEGREKPGQRVPITESKLKKEKISIDEQKHNGGLTSTKMTYDSISEDQY